MPSLVPYTNEVPITGFLRNAMPNVFDLTDPLDFLNDHSAVGVMLRIFEPVAAATFIAVTGNSHPEIIRTTIVTPQHYFVACSLEGGTTLTINASDTGVPVSVHLVGELHGPDLVLRDTPILFGDEPGNIDIWVERTVATVGVDIPSDVYAVISEIMSVGLGVAGLRKLGSTASTFEVDTVRSNRGWVIVEVDDDGKYETWTGGKDTPIIERDAHFVELGYILKTGNVVVIDAPETGSQLDVPLQFPSYGVLDLSGRVSSDAFVVGGRWDNAHISNVYKHFARAVGSTNGAALNVQTASHLQTAQANVMNLNAAREVEYVSENDEVDFQVTFYERPEQPAPPVQGPLRADILIRSGLSIKGTRFRSPITAKATRTKVNMSAKNVTSEVKVTYKEIRTRTALSTEGINVQ